MPATESVARWTVEQVLSLAPDDASRKAGNKLAAAGHWSGTGFDGSGAVWGLCKGSGSKPYQTVVDTTGPAYKCSCPSRKFPCKHALGLLLLRASDGGAVQQGEPADWAEQWLTARRGRAEAKQAKQEAAASGEPAPGPADGAAARKRAERRAERVTGGALELEQRLTDLLRGGLATADRAGYTLWEETAARMVDAQAPGLAGRVRELGAIPGSGPGWPVRLLEECGLLHLLDTAWLGRERLPEPLAATVRTRVGLPLSAEGPPVRDRWLVLAQYDTADGRLTTRRIWLYGRESGRTALLLSFGAAGRAPELALPVGVTIDAELTPYPGGGLRADLGRQFATPGALGVPGAPATPGEPGAAGAAGAPGAAGAAGMPDVPAPVQGTPPPGGSTAAALAAYGEALRGDPWLDAWPVTLRDVIPVPSEGGWQLADAEGESALPLSSAALSRPGLWKLVALSGGGPVTVFGEVGHRGFDPFAAWGGGGGRSGAASGPGGAADGTVRLI
ncbi:SWIM zinc finger [Streptomyces sp. ScaeMP-e83]|nr:SWIM zinc finger family protein [Streptomyces sp. SID4937]SCD83950.1 SWIM zinc finger [Streptomyces sp. ScaeMP-e83]